MFDLFTAKCSRFCLLALATLLCVRKYFKLEIFSLYKCSFIFNKIFDLSLFGLFRGCANMQCGRSANQFFALFSVILGRGQKQVNAILFVLERALASIESKNELFDQKSFKYLKYHNCGSENSTKCSKRYKKSTNCGRENSYGHTVY